jgi:hypothetical protein
MGIGRSDQVWYLYTAEGSQGPYSTEQIAEWKAAGQVGDDWQVWREGQAQWQRLGDTHEFLAEIVAPSPAPLQVSAVQPVVKASAKASPSVSSARRPAAARPAPVDSGISPKAVIIGFVVDIVGSMIVGMILTIAMFGMPTDPTAAAAVETQMMESMPFLVMSFVIGLGFTIVGGYVAGGVAGKAEWKNALAVGVLGICSGVLINMSGSAGNLPQWYTVGSYILVIPCAVFGGLMSQRS